MPEIDSKNIDEEISDEPIIPPDAVDNPIAVQDTAMNNNSDKNVVIIGANGSGKSSFARKTRLVR